MVQMQSNFAYLDTLLNRSPVLAEVHPLVPVCLTDDTELVFDAQSYIGKIDSLNRINETRAIILNQNSLLNKRFPSLVVLEHPPVEIINQNMPNRMDYLCQYLLTPQKIARHITRDVTEHHYDVVVLLLIDGLSYGDVLHWKQHVQPCFIDGVSVTYQIDADTKKPLSSVGFASIINRPSIWNHLQSIGIQHALGFTYWGVDDRNTVSSYLFDGIPNTPVENFGAIVNILRRTAIEPNTYIQIMRQGLDGLAHSKRELHQAEIDGAITAIDADIQSLIDTFHKQQRSAAIYITADHGILWKEQHDLQSLNINGGKSRYLTIRPDETYLQYMVRVEHENHPYYLLKYPYITSPIKRNDSGVHGGLSYQESIVPFAKFKVNSTWT